MQSRPSLDELYETNGFITKKNLKAKICYEDQESASQEMCYRYINSFRGAVDIGARYGGWSRPMEQKFEFIHAFEPRYRWRVVYPFNIKMGKVSLYPFGLGEKEEIVSMVGNRINSKGSEKVEIKTLDQFNLKNIDFIKIDTDGYELQVLKGGTKTILREKPLICMEVIPGEIYHGELAEEYLISLGGIILERCGQNTLFGW